MDRRHFISVSLMSSSATLLFNAQAKSSEQEQKPDIFSEITSLPNFCSHEHWGSIFSIGTEPGGFRADFEAGALPQRETTLADLIIDPYMGGNLNSSGISPWELKDDAGQKIDIYTLFLKSPEQGLKSLRNMVRRHQLTGTFLCLRQGLEAAYDFDVDGIDSGAVAQVNGRIDSNYKMLYQWYKELSAKASLSGLIRPVHPEYYASKQTRFAIQENKMTRTVLRIDPFMDLWKNVSRRKRLSEIVGIEPKDANSWRNFLERMFQLALENNAVGIKQMQAYSRDLNFSVHEDHEVSFYGELDAHEERVLQDWILHECCKLANDLSWPHQVHVGTHNLPHSNPMPLQSLAKLYPDQTLVLLHCWPFIDECGYLAKQVQNIYIDACWQPVLNPEFLKKSLDSWLGYVPLTKIMMGNDATSIEMAVGSSLMTKRILANALSHYAAQYKIDPVRIVQIARGFLHDNADSLYANHSSAK